MGQKLKANPVKKLLQSNRQTFGSWVTLAHPLVPELLAPAGFDWLAVDMEHSSIDLGDLLPLIMSIEANGMVPLVRVGENDPNLIKRVMDAGACGVIVANVNSAREAQAAVDAVKYPPAGKRGVGLYRAQGYGRQFEDYKHWLATQSIVIVQIEHISAVRDIDAIFSVKGIDAFMIGPYDLSGSLGRPGDFDHPDFKAALKTVMAAAKRHGITPGMHSVAADPALARRRMNEGFKFLAYSLDTILLSHHAAQDMARIRPRPRGR